MEKERNALHDEEEKKQILDNIEKYGCHLILINATDYLPAFVYSIGLYKKFNHPEIICFGLPTDIMATVNNHACDLISKGEKLIPGFLYSGFLQDYKIQFLAVDKRYYPDYLGYAGWFYDTFDFPAIQLIWPDKQYRFPWQDDFNPAWKFKQPLLDRNADFKFYEERNVAVFTTIQVLRGEPILYVYHNKDGDWQFHSSDSPSLEGAKLLCLEDITKIDPTINALYHLDYGYKASRNNKDDDWKIEHSSNKEIGVDQ